MINKIYSYILKSASGDYYHTITTKDYKDVYDYMKNEANGEYEAWKTELDSACGEFDETHIDYAYYDKQSLFLHSQSHWKPNEEQIYSLGTVVKGCDECTVGSVGYNLKELYEQLKKL